MFQRYLFTGYTYRNNIFTAPTELKTNTTCMDEYVVEKSQSKHFHEKLTIYEFFLAVYQFIIMSVK